MPLERQTKRDFVAEHRSEEHTSELQSQSNLVCRLLLEKKNKRNRTSRLVIHDLQFHYLQIHLRQHNIHVIVHLPTKLLYHSIADLALMIASLRTHRYA